MFHRTDRPPRPDFRWSKLIDGEMPLSELERIDDAVSRPVEEWGGSAGDAFASAAMSTVPSTMRTVWGRVTAKYDAEGTGIALYTWRPIYHQNNAPADSDPDAPDFVALEVNNNLTVPADVVVPFWPSEDEAAVVAGEKWRFFYPASGGDFETNFGDGSNTNFTITHNLGTIDVMVEIIRNSDGETVYPRVSRPTVNTIAVNFSINTVPTTNQYRTIVQKKGGGASGVGGPGSATDSTVVVFDGTSGRTVKGTPLVVSNTTGNLTGPSGGFTITGGTTNAARLTITSTSNTTPASNSTTDLLITSGDSNTIRSVDRVRHLTTATPGVGFGSNTAWTITNAGGSELTALTIGPKWSSLTNGSESADVVISAVRAGVLTTVATIASSGGLILPAVSGTTPGGVFVDSADGHLKFTTNTNTTYDLTATSNAPKLVASSIGNSNVANVSLTGLTGYRWYEIVGYDLQAKNASGDALWMRTSTDGGSTYDSGVSDYATSTGGDSKIIVHTGIPDDSASTHTAWFRVSFYNLAGTSLNKICSIFAGTYAGAATSTQTPLSGVRKSTADVDAVRFLCATNNLNGSFEVWGYP